MVDRNAIQITFYVPKDARKLLAFQSGEMPLLATLFKDHDEVMRILSSGGTLTYQQNDGQGYVNPWEENAHEVLSSDAAEEFNGIHVHGETGWHTVNGTSEPVLPEVYTRNVEGDVNSHVVLDWAPDEPVIRVPFLLEAIKQLPGKTEIMAFLQTYDLTMPPDVPEHSWTETHG